MALSTVLDELDEALTNSSKIAATLGDELLVYLIDMAILRVRKSSVHLEDNSEYRVHTLNANRNSAS